MQQRCDLIRSDMLKQATRGRCAERSSSSEGADSISPPVCLLYLFPAVHTEQALNSNAAAPLKRRCALIQLLMISSCSCFLDPSYTRLFLRAKVKRSDSVRFC